MGQNSDFTGEIYVEEFDVGWEAVIACARPVTESVFIDEFKLSHHFLPSDGKYIGSRFTVRASVASEWRETATSATDNSVCVEFEAEVIASKNEEYHWINLLCRDDGTKHGMTMFHPKFAPTGLTNEGDTYSIVLEIEYDHERTKEVQGYSEEHIKHRRKAALDDIEEFQKSV